MAVYVDNAKHPLGRMKMCHMIADSEAEVHAFAKKLGLSEKWFHAWHYNLCQSKRDLAIMLGAIPVDTRSIVAIRSSLSNAAMAQADGNP